MALRYPWNTVDTIGQYVQTQDGSLDLLFSDENQVSNVVCCTVNERLSGQLLSKALARPLEHHDVVILGRRSLEEEECVGHDKEYEKAVGQLGSDILKHSLQTSLFIVQSPF